MHIASALFDRSAPDLDSCPDESLPEFAFIGRSNVGKSSLLNTLSGKAGLAKVSPVPGHTKLINHFTINKTWRLVDLPGYGYANVARADKSKFNDAVSEYLEHRANLCLVFALIDSGLAPQDIDIEFMEWLVQRQVPFVLVFTKIDNFPASVVQANIAAFTERIAKWFVQPPAVFKCSAKTGDGRAELLGVIEENLAAIKAEARSSPPSAQSPAPAPKQRPAHLKKNRPW
jgi:GTP-binding protein